MVGLLLAAFERDGVVLVPGALPPDLLGRLRAAFDVGLATVPPAVPVGWLAAHPGACPAAGGVRPVEHPMAGAGPHGAASRRYPHVLRWAAPFLELVDNAAVRPLLAAALGEEFVLDHDCELQLPARAQIAPEAPSAHAHSACGSGRRARAEAGDCRRRQRWCAPIAGLSPRAPAFSSHVKWRHTDSVGPWASVGWQPGGAWRPAQHRPLPAAARRHYHRPPALGGHHQPGDGGVRSRRRACRGRFLRNGPRLALPVAAARSHHVFPCRNRAPVPA